ncbi:2-nitropropane dioxygenase [Glomus cerebriforme]|uniref:2-nitropropane dioxygenase n=1 Tax=Glomus cerebriforme TaxID=658196 RepID=A0A397SZK9_9GLOM|nr:2-nitropropane dioxygenase [Glomus cerebriforme]
MSLYSFNTGFIELFKEYGIKYPIVKAPMARIDDTKLVSEVYLAGGLSFLSTGYKSYEDLENDLKSIHELLKSHINPTNGLLPIGIAFMTFALDSEFSSSPSSSNTLLHLTLSYKPLAIWFSFGDFSKYVPIVHSLSPHTKIFAQVQTIEQAVHAYQNNADVIVVQGNESGGHGLVNGASTLTLVPEAIDTLNQIYSSKDENLKKPIILAAGGIIDGRGLASILLLGGDGVVMGTRFIVCKESAAHPDAKKIIINTSDGGRNTVRTQIFDKLRDKNGWPSQWDGRAIKNKTVEENEKFDDDDEKVGEKKKVYKEAILGKDYSRAVIYAGAGIGLIHSESSTKEILENTAKVAIETIERAYNTVIPKANIQKSKNYSSN